jgi:integrase/recombinase XerD
MQIVNEKGERLYFTDEQRKALLTAAAKAPREVKTFCNVLCYTGCRISEALALTAKNIDLSAKVIVIESLKKRKSGIHRQVPVPTELLDTLDNVHGIREIQKRGRAGLNERLWPWCRMTAWRKMDALMKAAGIEDGPHASPKGLRHGFGVNAVGRGVSLNMVQKWLGHSALTTTAIYANAVGEEEQEIASRMWA